jgi:hypothetical protein
MGLGKGWVLGWVLGLVACGFFIGVLALGF